MTLSKRLLCVASFVPEGSFIADVGSDHAQIPLFLLQNHRIRGAEAIENKKGPFKRMSSAVLSSPYKENIVLSLSDGISILDHRVDAVVLAGMGGRLIQKILQEHPENLRQVKSLIIDAHSERDVLFAFLGEKGFRISQESFFMTRAFLMMSFKQSKRRIRWSIRGKNAILDPLISSKKVLISSRIGRKSWSGCLLSLLLVSSPAKTKAFTSRKCRQ